MSKRSRDAVCRSWRIAGLVACAIAVASTHAGAAPGRGARHAVLVVDGNSGRVLSAENADEPRYPASLTKMMTLYLTFEALERGVIKPDTLLRISQEAAAQQPSKLELEPGQTIAVMDAVRALITKSANDVAVAVAEHLAGSERAFAAQMTAKAQAIGMTRTTFRNASGLPDSGQLTTARDMITLALRLHDDFPKYYPLFALRAFSYQGRSYANHNTLLKSFQGTEGMKTGYIGASGYNVVAVVRRGQKHLFGAVFGGSSGSGRNATMQAAFLRTLPIAANVRTRPAAQATMVAAVRPARQQPTALTIAPLDGAAAQPAAGKARAVIAVTQVRRVGIAPRTGASTAADGAGAASVASPAAPLQVPQLATALVPSQSSGAGRTGTDGPPQRPQREPQASTLDAQAQALRSSAGGQPSSSPARVAALAANQPSHLIGSRPDVADASYHVQIGAFLTQIEAERALAGVRTRVTPMLADARPLTIPVMQSNRQLFRARFAGFTSKQATDTCLELRRQAIDCFVMKGE